MAVIHADGVHEPCDDVFHGNPLMNGALDVASDEGGALIVEIGRHPAFHGHVGNILHGDAEALLGRFLQE